MDSVQKEASAVQVRELLKLVRAFQSDLIAHRNLVKMNSSQRRVAVSNKIEEQSLLLARSLGRLRPYLNRFRSQWGIVARGRTWDGLDAAVGAPSIFKSISLDRVIPTLGQIIGRLESLNPDDDVPADPATPLRSGAPIDKIMRAYLEHLHPVIRGACVQLFVDRHYTHAVEESVKAVLQHIRNRTIGRTDLPSDGAKLVEAVFSAANPVLSYGDLSDENVRNQQLGFMRMVAGLSIGVRNPRSHTQGKKDDLQIAFEYLVLASLFCRRIDQADRV